MYSNCCSAKIKHGDICCDCGEHCDALVECDGCHELCDDEEMETKGEGVTEMYLCEDCRRPLPNYSEGLKTEL